MADQLKKKKKFLGNDQILGPDITMKPEKRIKENMADGMNTFNSLDLGAKPGKQLGADK